MNRTGPLTGLLGGSFNPAHAALRRISLAARDALGLDEVWWLVSPGNPLKPKAGMAPLAARVRSARAEARHGPIRVTAIERELDTPAMMLMVQQENAAARQLYLSAGYVEELELPNYYGAGRMGIRMRKTKGETACGP